MARKLSLTLISFSLLSSCAFVKPLNNSGKGELATTERPSIDSSSLNREEENKSVLKDLNQMSQLDEETIVEVASDDELEQIKLVKEEEEIIEKYEKEDLKKEDPVSSVAEKEAELTLDYKKKHYDFWINYFTKRDSARFKRHVKNGVRFKKIVEQVFEEEGLPKDLFYVGLIESGFNTHIRSHASAVGPWQFIKGTAKRYSLYVDKELDERRSIYKATYAAAQYFKDLYNIFGSWELALCAYNAGEYRIINAIRKGNTRDYKLLVSKKLLPKETIFYIPKVAAAKKLFAQFSHGVKTPKSELYEDAFEIKVKKPLSLKSIAKKIGVSRKTLKTLNPDIRWDYVGRRRRGFSLFVPTAKKELAMETIESLPKRKRVPARVASKTLIHRVQRGESLYRIARKYKTTISQLKDLNRLRRNKIFVGQKLKVTQKGGRVYIVRRGDSLYGIARKFGLSVNKIRSANRLSSSKIFPKQEIILPI